MWVLINFSSKSKYYLGIIVTCPVDTGDDTKSYQVCNLCIGPMDANISNTRQLYCLGIKPYMSTINRTQYWYKYVLVMISRYSLCIASNNNLVIKVCLRAHNICVTDLYMPGIATIDGIVVSFITLEL